MLLVTALLCLTDTAFAQPFAAAGGFDRPVEVAITHGTTRVDLAGSDGSARLFWSDNSGIYSQDFPGAEQVTQVLEGRGVRELAAAEVHGDPAIAWARRDLRTALSEHRVRWRGEERMLLESHQAYRLSLVEAPEGPAVLIARFEEDANVLRLIGWDGTETVVRRSEDSLVQYVASFDEEGVAHVAWLEGFTERGALLGPSGEWKAYITTVTPGGAAAPPTELGFARYQGSESQVAIGLTANGPRVLWPGPNGEVMFGGPGIDSVVVGRGSPVGISSEGEVYWSEGFSIRRRTLRPSTEPVNVSWSPSNITRGELVETGGDNFLTWYGPTRDGLRIVYGATDATPFKPGLLDRVAAAMGWNPWNFWEALVGQLLGALFAGVLIAMVLSPVLWAVAAAAVRGKMARDTTISGISVGALTMLGLLALAALRSNLPQATHFALFGSLPELLTTLALAAIVTWAVRRRSDSEQLIGVLGSAWLFVFLGTSTLAFITFQAWMEYWTRVT